MNKCQWHLIWYNLIVSSDRKVRLTIDCECMHFVDVLLFCIVIGHAFFTVPCVPFGFSLQIKHSRAFWNTQRCFVLALMIIKSESDEKLNKNRIISHLCSHLPQLLVCKDHKSPINHRYLVVSPIALRLRRIFQISVKKEKNKFNQKFC